MSLTHIESFIMNHSVTNDSNLFDSQAHILIEIERLVQSIALGQHQSNQNVYRQIFDHLPRYLAIYHPRYDYSEHIEAFWQGCRYVDVLNTNGLVSEREVEALVDHIAIYVKNPVFKRSVSDRRYQTKDNRTSIEEYARRLHDHHSRLLVVRVDFNYRMENQHHIMIDDVYRHLDKMRKAKNGLQFFESLVGSAWCIEQGVTRGYHIHAVYYFLGSKHKNDWYMANQIGLLWESVTDRLGTFYSCNTSDEKAKYERKGMLGVGMIHRDDTEACNNAINAVSYLSDADKDDQYLRMKPIGRRAFATGIITRR
jgi:hypothetical protein